MEFAVNYLISKIVVDKTKIKREHYKRVEPLINDIKKWASVVEGFDTTQPETWLGVLSRVGNNIIEQPRLKQGPIVKFISSNNLTEPPEFTEMLVGFAMEHAIIRPMIETSTEKLCQIEMNEGQIVNGIYFTLKDSGDRPEIGTCWVDPKGHDIGKLINRFWEENPIILVDKDRVDDFTFKPHSFRKGVYKGEALELIDEFESFKKAGIRRVVLLQGKPGTGKSTFCEHVARKLSKKTMVLTHSWFSSVSRRNWEDFMGWMKPDMVIIDDIDRVSSRSLEASLPFFEDSNYNVPLTIVTTNDHTRLNEAFRRPGRIDICLYMQTPGEEVKKDIIKEFCEELGMAYPPENIEQELLTKLNEQPATYTKEMLRRYKVLGFDYEPQKNDLVFGDRQKKGKLM